MTSFVLFPQASEPSVNFNIILPMGLFIPVILIKKNSFTRKMFRILTKKILTCLFKKKGLFWFKIARKLPKKR